MSTLGLTNMMGLTSAVSGMGTQAAVNAITPKPLTAQSSSTGLAVMPAPQGDVTRKAQIAEAQALARRRGRASTILTPFSNDKLGA